jgi:hypothetical protein
VLLGSAAAGIIFLKNRAVALACMGFVAAEQFLPFGKLRVTGYEVHRACGHGNLVTGSQEEEEQIEVENFWAKVPLPRDLVAFAPNSRQSTLRNAGAQLLKRRVAIASPRIGAAAD